MFVVLMSQRDVVMFVDVVVLLTQLQWSLRNCHVFGQRAGEPGRNPHRYGRT